MAAGLPKVLLLGDPKKGHVRRILDGYLPWIEARCEVVGVSLDREEDLEGYEADLCLVFGGDGTILSAARRMGRRQIPTLGVNLGRLGFLAEVTREGIEEVLEQAFAGRLEEEKRLLLECELPGERGPVLLLNDVVVQRGESRSLIGISTHVDEEYVTTYVGDGLVLASPVGSTAYSLAAGGPILAPDLDAYVLTPLAPHALPVRPLVVSGRHALRLTVEGPSGRPCGTVTIDGQVRVEVRGGDRIGVRVSKTRFRLLTSKGNDFFRILRKKFGWAGSPAYAKRKR